MTFISFLINFHQSNNISINLNQTTFCYFFELNNLYTQIETFQQSLFEMTSSIMKTDTSFLVAFSTFVQTKEQSNEIKSNEETIQSDQKFWFPCEW